MDFCFPFLLCCCILLVLCGPVGAHAHVALAAFVDVWLQRVSHLASSMSDPRSQLLPQAASQVGTVPLLGKFNSTKGPLLCKSYSYACPAAPEPICCASPTAVHVLQY